MWPMNIKYLFTFMLNLQKKSANVMQINQLNKVDT